MSDVEIEIRFILNEPEKAKIILNKSAKLISENIYQKDSYFVPAHRDFLAIKYPFEWLRLRQSTKGVSINYKHWYPENAAINDYCNEFETKLESFEKMEKILKSLDFKEAVVVEKVRATWMYKDVEIVIDEVTGLGCFIELEAKKDFSDAKEGIRYLQGVLQELKIKVGAEDQKGYPYGLLKKKGYDLG